ncbi:MAG: redox-regulated ATPase YchF [Dehalococcoidales bacterium]|nr:redox-regulated ATPase YchF [Dehalococcoidales bacterium]
MGLSCGLVGLPQCGKTVIFNAITAAGVNLYGGSELNRAIVNLPDQRINKMVNMYHPRKTIYATLEVVDIPGLKVSQDGSNRSSKLLGNIKNVEALLHVVRCFEDANVPFEYDTINPQRDVETVDLELMAADSITLKNKIERTEKKAKSGDKDAIREHGHAEKVFAAIQEGIPARKQKLTAQEIASVKECNLVSLKPVVYIANIKTMADAANKHVSVLKKIAVDEGAEVITICGKDEADISQLAPEERAEFLKDLGLQESSMERLMHAAYKRLGLISFFTVGEDEVRAWTCQQGDKAPTAAGKIHTDLEKGFIRMEVMRYEDLIELGSEAALTKAGKLHVQGRDYEVQDGDIVQVLFNK